MNGEIKVWLLLLDSVKTHYLYENPGSDFILSAVKVPQVSESVVRCSELFKKLDEFIVCGDGGKDQDTSNYKASATLLQAQFYDIIESDPEKQKLILKRFIDDKNVKSKSKVHIRRWYTRLFLSGQIPIMPIYRKYASTKSCRIHTSLENYNYLLGILEET